MLLPFNLDVYKRDSIGPPNPLSPKLITYPPFAFDSESIPPEMSTNTEIVISSLIFNLIPSSLQLFIYFNTCSTSVISSVEPILHLVANVVTSNNTSGLLLCAPHKAVP